MRQVRQVTRGCVTRTHLPRAVFHVGFTESGGVEFSKKSVILHVASRDKSYSLGQDLHLTVTLNTKDNETGESI